MLQQRGVPFCTAQGAQGRSILAVLGPPHLHLLGKRHQILGVSSGALGPGPVRVESHSWGPHPPPRGAAAWAAPRCAGALQPLCCAQSAVSSGLSPGRPPPSVSDSGDMGAPLPLLGSCPSSLLSAFLSRKNLLWIFKVPLLGDPWVVQRFSTCLWPRARSWRPGMESHVGLLVHGACFSLCLCLCLSLSVTIINK